MERKGEQEMTQGGGEERRGNRKRGAVDGEMQELKQFNRRPCLKRRGLFSDRDPSQEAELQNRLIEVVKSSRWLILHNAQPRQPREETPPRLSLTPAAECRTEPLLCVPSQTPSLAEQLEKYLPLIFFSFRSVGEVFLIGLLYLLPFIGKAVRGIELQRAELLWKAAAAFLQNNKERLAAAAAEKKEGGSLIWMKEKKPGWGRTKCVSLARLFVLNLRSFLKQYSFRPAGVF